MSKDDKNEGKADVCDPSNNDCGVEDVEAGDSDGLIVLDINQVLYICCH